MTAVEMAAGGITFTIHREEEPELASVGLLPRLPMWPEMGVTGIKPTFVARTNILAAAAVERSGITLALVVTAVRAAAATAAMEV
jgi:hypothetical protein